MHRNIIVCCRKALSTAKTDPFRSFMVVATSVGFQIANRSFNSRD